MTPIPGRALVYMIGVPGAGKSTVMAHATTGMHRQRLLGQPGRDLLIGARPGGQVRAVELGARRPGFSGTDALPLNAVRHAERWLRAGDLEADLILGEGQRLGNAPFLSAAVAAGLAVTLVHLAVPARVAAQRRTQRAAALGRPEQNAVWVAAASTHVRQLARNPPAGVQVVTLDGRRPSPALAAAVWDLARIAQRPT